MDAEEMIAEARKAFFVMFGFLAVVWVIQIVNWADHYALSQEYGVIGHRPGRLADIFTSPFLHWSWAHIESNSGPLFIFGFLAAYRGVTRFLGLSALVVVTSGLAVWFFQGGDVDTVGASGLIFGYFGYVVVRGLFDRHLIDTLIGVVMAASFAYLLTVAIPGTPGVSWLGHLGGLVGGVAGGWIFRDRTRNAARPYGGSGSAGSGGPGASFDEPSPGRHLPARPGDGDTRADLHKELGDLGLL
ncbi:rhomboid family intramembrane serine protease [Streptomyces sp. SL13]|uniref:Rhomboid family intramembrane serine protease n=1 Tax=Streptantibioticus silvisoli TaxID=2705255 RepID=A0AA90H987_9ACTN|nr:rhomboid family intramembrane serine protease [Streptantibioticus silvisoli]MDI5971165.1 rhomboid family intramembrane serine protease [Streptantibioticus silvisoli]